MTTDTVTLGMGVPDQHHADPWFLTALRLHV